MTQPSSFGVTSARHGVRRDGCFFAYRGLTSEEFVQLQAQAGALGITPKELATELLDRALSRGADDAVDIRDFIRSCGDG